MYVLKIFSDGQYEFNVLTDQKSTEDNSFMMGRIPQFRLVSHKAILYALDPSHQDTA